jgi:ribosomal protein S18 acetylase RimI-like enzyme
MCIQYCYDDDRLSAEEFVELFNARRRKQIDVLPTRQALGKTINVTARDGQLLVGCLRILSDGYLMSVVTDVTVHPEYRNIGDKTGIGSELLKLASNRWPLNLLHASHRASDEMMAAIGWSPGFKSFVLIKETKGQIGVGS